MDLSTKQQRFCQEYLVDLNATQAAVRAGYSAKTATPSASRLLTNVKVSTQIQKLKSEREIRTRITTDDVATGGLSDVAKDGKSRSARVRSLELLGKHLGMFTEKLQVTHDEEQPHVVVYLPDNGRG